MMKKNLSVLFMASACVLTGAKEMQIPDRWQPPKIGGRDYWIAEEPCSFIIRNPAMMAMPLHRDMVWRMRRTKGLRIDFLGKIMTQRARGVSVAFWETRNPIILDTTCWYETVEEVAVPESSWQAFRKTAGDRILGTVAPECFQSFASSKKRFNLPVPKSREELYELLRGTCTNRTRTLFRDLSILYNWGLPRYLGTASYFDHMLLEFGSQSAGHECGCGINDMPMQFAVSRGAARQYGTFFYSFNATHNRTLKYPGQKELEKGHNFRSYSHRNYHFLTPQERRTKYTPNPDNKFRRYRIFQNEGPECGIPDSEYRRRIIYGYLGGTGLYTDESGMTLLYSLYDYKMIDQADPLAVNLRDKKWHLSRTGELLADFYANLVCKMERGAVMTPIALVWDRYHGYGPKYSGPMPWGRDNPFPLPGDKMFAPLEWLLFPSSLKSHEQVCHRTGPFGDIFDVITNDASQDAMNAYPALLLTGDVDMVKKGFGGKLISYVKNGGTLIASRCQLKNLSGLPEIPDRESVSEVAFGKGKLIVSKLDYWLSNEPVTTSNRAFQKIDDSLGKVIRRISEEQLPVKVDGDIQYMINRTADSVIVSLFNNYGDCLSRTWENPNPPPDPKYDVTVTVKPNPEFKYETVREWFTGSNQLTIKVPAGDVRIVKFIVPKAH